MNKQIMLIAISLLCGLLNATDNRSMILRINGHDYFMEDALIKGINEKWQSSIEEMEADLIAKDNIDGANLNKPISIHYETSEVDPTFLKINYKIKNLWISLNMNSYSFFERVGLFLLCALNQHGNYQFDLNIYSIYQLQTDSQGIHLKRNYFNVDVEDFTCTSDRGSYELVSVIIAGIVVAIREYVKYIIFNEEIPSEVEKVFPDSLLIADFSLFSESGSGIVVENASDLIEDLIQSFPLIPEIKVEDNGGSGPSNINRLVIEMDLLPGYGETPTTYLNGDVTLPEEPSININGFSPVGNSYSFHPNDELDWTEKIDSTHDKMLGMGASHIRIDAIWNYITPNIPTININEIPSPEELLEIINSRTDTDYGFDQNDKYGWNWLDTAITDAKSKSINPVVLLGYGLENSTPKYDGKHIAPGTPYRVNNAGDIIVDDNYREVTEEVYKKWLEVITKTIVLKYKDDVEFWGAECELNAARYTESFGWWRKGEAWRDDNFQTEIASLMYNAIKGVDSSSQVIQTFHIFEMAKRIDEWQNYYDIVGLNFYPNALSASPVFGYMVGELVYSAKRALNTLGIDKQVWVVETSYSEYCGIDEDVSCPDINPENYNAFEDSSKKVWTQERQSQYLREALESSAKYGADGFNWFRLYSTNEGTGENSNYSFINNYGGLFNGNEERLAYHTYQDQINNLSDYAFAKIVAKTESGIILSEGRFKVNGYYTTVESDQIIRIPKDIPLTASVLTPVLINPETDETLFHHRWNSEHDSLTLDYIFIVIGEDIEANTQNAIYRPKKTVSFETNLSPLKAYKTIEIRDPWYLDGAWHQKNVFVNLDTNSYKFFKNEGGHPNNIEYPYYFLHAPQFTLYMSDENVFEYSTFDHWIAKDENNTTLNANNYFTDPSNNTSPVMLNDNISKIKSNYDTKTIGVSEGVYLEISGGLLFAVAPENKIENNQILKFDHWSSTTEDGVTFNNNSRYFSEMILNNESVEISANYICANCEGVPITISSNSNLTINEGQFICHPDFSIYVEGQLFIEGTEQNHILFEPESGTENLLGGIYVSQGGHLTMNYVDTYNQLYSFNGYAIILEGGQATITNCRFMSVPEGGIQISSSANAYITNNVFQGTLQQTYINTGFHCEITQEFDNPLTIRNNTIIDFKTGLSVFCNTSEDGNVFNMTNNIFYYSDTTETGTICFDETISDFRDVDIDYNLSYGYDDIGLDNIANVYHRYWLEDIDPLMTNNYYLTENSPSIDAGDPNSPLDPDQTIADLGAFHYVLPNVEIDIDILGEVGDPPQITWDVIDIPDGIIIDVFEIYSYNEFDQTPVLFSVAEGVSIIDDRFIIAYIEEDETGRNVGLMKMDRQSEQTSRIKQYWTIKLRDTAGHLSDFSDAEYAWVEVNGEIFKLATPIIPKDYELNSAFPNPFNPTITIPFGLPLESDVSISIYNVMGQRIRLLQSDHIKAGFHQVQWKELTNSGHKVPSGMYIVKLNAVSTDGRKSFQKSQKIVLLK